MKHTATPRCAMTLLELMIGLSITALIAGAISGMMSAVSTGLVSGRDHRATMIRAAAAQARLSAYLAPGRCLLEVRPDQVVLWLGDDRADDRVQASEVRWIRHNPMAGTLEVHAVRFPSAWTAATRDLENQTLSADAAWDTVLSSYAARGLVDRLTLVDGLSGFTAEADQPDAFESRQLLCEVTVTNGETTEPVRIAASIRSHKPPEDAP
jgi:hypothetical protein